jgi:hypothetical protein
MFLAFLRLLRTLWSPRATLLPVRRPRLAPAVEALEDRWLPSTIGGLVYFDPNNNGLHDPGEPGLAGNTIQLYNSTGTLLATTQTDSTGHYLFATDPTVAPKPGTQEVDADFAAARTNTTQTQSVAQFNPALGTLKSVEIINDATLTSRLKVENDDSESATVTGSVNATLSLQAGGLAAVPSTAVNSDNATLGAADGSDDFAGASGRDFGTHTANGTNDVTFDAASSDLSQFIGTGSVSLTESAQATSSITGAGNLLAAVNAQSSAHVRVIYHYESGAPLASGDYTVVQPSDPAGYLHGLETADNVTALPGSDQTNSIAVQLANSDSLNNNFGERKLSTVSGTVYLDANGDGQLNAGDSPLAGVTLNLTGTDDLGNQITGTQQTGADGSYTFSGLRPGSYAVSAVQPAGYLPGTDSVGSLGGSVSGNSISLNVPWSSAGTGYNFGEVLPPNPGTHSGGETPPTGSGGTTTPAVPEAPMMSKRDFIGGAWTKWGW